VISAGTLAIAVLNLKNLYSGFGLVFYGNGDERGYYNMKKNIICLFLMAFLVVGTFGGVLAAEEDDVVPEAKKVGFFEDRMDRMMLAFTFNKEKRIDRTLDMAEKRLAEAEVFAEDDLEAYEEAQARYAELVADAEDVLADLESGAEDIADSEASVNLIARIQNRFEIHQNRADEVYVRSLERFEANNASDEKVARFEEFHERAWARSENLEDRLIERRENIIENHKILSNMSEEELEDLLVEVEASEGLTEARDARLAQVDDRIERLEASGTARINSVSERLASAENLSEAERIRIQAGIDSAERQLARAPRAACRASEPLCRR